jgi:hypothetical protein
MGNGVAGSARVFTATHLGEGNVHGTTSRLSLGLRGARREVSLKMAAAHGGDECGV